MVWATIKAVYGYVIEVADLNNPDLFDEDGYIDYEKLRNMFGTIKFDCTPERIKVLNEQPTLDDELIKCYQYSMNGDGIAVGKRAVDNTIRGKFVNGWASRDVIDETYDYSIPEFKHYVDKKKFHHYNLLHKYHCCSESMKKYVIIGVTYDEVDRNLFLDSQFDSICDNVFNHPTKIKDIDDTFFQHDSRDYISPRGLSYREYTSEIRSLPNVRKKELLSPDPSIVLHVNSLKNNCSPELKQFLGEPNCYLMLDDCTFCT